MKKILSSWGVSLSLLLLYGTLLGVATWVESRWGTTLATKYIYKSVWFILLQAIMVASAVAVMIKSQLFKRKLYGAVTLHIALIMILVGALTTHLWGYEGYLHLREGQSSDQLVVMSSDRQEVTHSVTLPFSLTLDDFVLERYPGSQSPSSYESFLTVERKEGGANSEHIYMNRVLDVDHYRIFQASYDPDEQGSVLTISYDPLGTSLSYLGYFLLALGFVVVLFERNSYFGRRVRELGELHRKMGATVAVALLLLLPLGAGATELVVPQEIATEFARLQVQSPSGRMEPVGTYSEQLLRKLHRSGSYKGQSSDQVLLGIVAYPDMWTVEPIFSTKNEEVATLIGVGEGEPFALSDLFGGGTYILEERVTEIYGREASGRSKTDKEILKIDERANILYALQRGLLLSLFPHPGHPNDKWLSSGDDLSELEERDNMFVSKVMFALIQEIEIAEVSGDTSGALEIVKMIDLYQQKQSSSEILQSPRQVTVELLYNRLAIFSRAAFSYMTLGMLLLALSLLQLNRPRKWSLWALRCAIGVVILIFAAHTAALAARGYVSGRAPWANGYESMIFVAWSGVLAGVLFIRRSYLTFAMATLLGGIVLLVAHLNFLDPEITPLVPVLKSYWLMFHVAIITASYGFFGMSFLLSTLNLSMVAFGRRASERREMSLRELYIVSELSLTIGLALLSVGTFLGAIWANESWGRYWGWDPKETWALISMIVYALVLHARFIPKLNSSFAFNTLTIYALGSILMTYFGVNYFLGGLHSYAGGDTPTALWGIAVLYALLTGVVVAAWRKL